ncbi:ADP-ribosylglycohydrolase family protein [Deferribacteraceae bacterium V6Fe1]|nr:ADP-ribosylglycohydrolase family protein [Deferribacteraceae bacterium V6Fe1]
MANRFSENFDKVSDCLHSKEVLSVLNETDFEVADRVRGMIAGNIIGDMLGLPLEGKSGNIGPYPPLELNEKCTTEIKELIWSDDTSMLMALAASLYESGGKVNTDSERKHYLKWFYEGKYTPNGRSFGYGNTTKEALISEKAGTDRSSNGNGALMRSSVIVPYYLKKTDRELDEASADSCAVTHGHPVSIFTNMIYTYILKKLIYGYSFEESLTLAKARYYDIIGDINEIFEKPVFYTTTAYCVTTLQTSVYVNLESDNFEEAVVKAVNLGGDADTIGAVTGALAGAGYGFESINERYKGAVLSVIRVYPALQKFFKGIL